MWCTLCFVFREELDREMDIYLYGEEKVRAKMAEKRKNDLDDDLDAYFAELDSDQKKVAVDSKSKEAKVSGDEKGTVAVETTDDKAEAEAE